MGTVFLTNLAAVAKKYEQYDVFVHHVGFWDPQPFIFKKALAT